METFTGLRGFVDNPRYHEQRRESLSGLDMDIIDTPIVDIINGLAGLPYCFTLQSCYGHFLPGGRGNPRGVEPLPASDSITRVEYRVAYIALCIQDSEAGRCLFHGLREMTALDPEYVQFGCAEWFWERQVNSYVLQVEPERHMAKDRVFVGYREAMHLEKTRNEVFIGLRTLIGRERGKDKSP